MEPENSGFYADQTTPFDALLISFFKTNLNIFRQSTPSLRSV